ncbi:hypothetical protein IPO96_02880 [Candidatus Saccharibacteria bacterium]|nr:MAG: hypothetical protein IPO96_02880 [Candidatus Saccharibacteria bacterium]
MKQQEELYLSKLAVFGVGFLCAMIAFQKDLFIFTAIPLLPFVVLLLLAARSSAVKIINNQMSTTKTAKEIYILLLILVPFNYLSMPHVASNGPSKAFVFIENASDQLLATSFKAFLISGLLILILTVVIVFLEPRKN